METFKKKVIKSAIASPRLRVRYVDEAFVIWSKGADQLEEFHQYLNRPHWQIQFTRKIEADNQISFLDGIWREMLKPSPPWCIGVYSKPTHTDLYTSHCHPSVKLKKVRCDDTSMEEQLTNLRDTFRRNGYPEGIITTTSEDHPGPVASDEEPPTTDPHKLLLPYM